MGELSWEWRDAMTGAPSVGFSVKVVDLGDCSNPFQDQGWG